MMIEEWLIETPRLLLRPFQRSDAAEVSRLCNDREVTKSTLSLPFPYPLAAAESWIAGQPAHFDSGLCYEFAVTDRENGTLYGCVSLSRHAAHKNGELGYWIGQEYWNRGIASEAARALVDWAFAHGFHRVYARHFASNPASGRVMQKLGMAYEGTQREHMLKDGHYEDIVLYGLLCDK